MSRVGLNSNSFFRPRLASNSSKPSSYVVEVITKKSIDQISDLNFVAAHLAYLDEGVDDFRYPEGSFFAFPQPLNSVHSRARTIRLTMPSAKDSGVEEKVSLRPSYMDISATHSYVADSTLRTEH